MVVYDTILFSQLKVLRQLRSITSKTAQQLHALNIPSSTPNQPEARDVTFAPLNLPFPEEILTPILRVNAPENLRNAIRGCFANHIAALQLKYTTNYQQMYTFMLQTGDPAPKRSLREAYLNLYLRQCHVFVETQLPYVKQEVARLEHTAQRHDTTKTEFNHAYTPILESYFAYNAYPSLPDRLLLARKSMMTPRQIEVWFQNHRNRAKKDGVALRRISPHTASTFAFDNLVPQIPQVTTSSRSRSATVEAESSDDDVSLEHLRESVFSDHRPPHAFPAPYSPQPGSDPFSYDKQVFQTTSRHWMRSPATHTPRRSSISNDDLATLFAQMNMRASKSSRGSKATKQRTWFSTLVLEPPAAPHPAIVSPSYAPPLPAVQISNPCTWQKPSLCVRKSTTPRAQASYPSWAVPGTPRRRKSPCLPRREPSSHSNTHHFGSSPRTSSWSSSSSSSISSSSSRSTSMSGLSSRTAVELSDTTPRFNFDDTADYPLFDTEWNLHSSSASKCFALSMSQHGISDLSQSLSLPAFVTMDLPGFTFFES